MACDSSRIYEPGDLIYKSKPYVRVIRQDLWSNVCAWCLSRRNELRACSGCKLIRYCGKICQKAAWKDHKLECPFLPRYTAGPHHFLVQMVGNLILKTKGKKWESITDEVMGQNVSFDDLKFQHMQLLKLPWFRITLKVIETALKSYLGEENVPDEETLLQLIGKVECNHYSFGEEGTTTWSLFIGASKFDHSCVPNANVHFDGKNIQVRAIKTIAKSEKVTFSYCPMLRLFDGPALQSNMKNLFGEEGCNCNDCSQPYGQSPLTMILDPVRAVPILEETEGNLLMASLMSIYKYPMQGFTQEKLKQLLKKQEGVLGDTNLARIRLLAFKCLLLTGNIYETRDDLITLERWVKLAWGENYVELTEIYQKLIAISGLLRNVQLINYYIVKLARLRIICIGEEEATRDYVNAIRNLFT